MMSYYHSILTGPILNRFPHIIIIIIIISTFIERHVCLQKAAEALVRYRSDGLVTAIKQECLKMSFKTMF